MGAISTIVIPLRSDILILISVIRIAFYANKDNILRIIVLRF